VDRHTGDRRRGVAFGGHHTVPHNEDGDVELIIQLVMGAIGGNIGGALMKNLSLGPLGNSIAGIVGGGIGGQILSAVMGSGGATTSGMVGDVAGGGVGGILVMIIVGLIKNAMAKAS
jgi:uncharacterized membrane protein YeaQ/YmgE (transglycosylase-associated protein family)